MIFKIYADKNKTREIKMKKLELFLRNQTPIVKNGLLYDPNQSEYLGTIEKGCNYSFNRYDMYKTKKNNYFLIRSYWRSLLDGSTDSEKLINMDEREFKKWLSEQDFNAFVELFNDQFESA